MKKFLRTITFFTILLTLVIAPVIGKAKNRDNLIQMAILLDTSSSMNGLIDQAKSQLWKIVNELALSKKNGSRPKLEVALYEYGKSSLAANEGYLRMIAPLTSDLDLISEELFNLRTNGGSEFCGQVIQASTQGLKWTNSHKALKVIFIAGNEPFTQGKIDYVESCKNAISEGIIVNTIFCGNYHEGVKTKWKHGAELSDGKYMNINHNQKIIPIEAPQDKKIIELGNRLNRTYIAFGKEGNKKKELQSKQDTNAASVSQESSVQRSVTKSSGQYKNETWDLIDALEKNSVKLQDLKEEELPEELRNMSEKEKKEYLAEMHKERKAIQKEINKLNEERKIYLKKEMKLKAEKDTLDSAIIKAIREQAKSKNFKWEEK
jgi:hypothetical protein